MSQENDLIEGLDVVPLASVSQQNVFDFLVKATPSLNKGFVLFQATEPDIASNPRYNRYLWFDTVNLQLKRYDPVNLIWTPILTASVTVTTQIDDGVITLSKLDPTEGQPGFIIHKNAVTGDIEWVSLIGVLDVGSLALNLLSTLGSSEGSIIQIVGGVAIWTTQETLASAVLSQLTSLDPTLLSGAGPNTVLIADANSNIGFFGIDTFFGLIAAGSLPVDKLSTSGSSDGYFLKVSAGKPVWQATTFPLTKPIYTADDTNTYNASVGIPLGTAGGFTTETILPFTHSLGGIPKLHRVSIVCTTAEGVYAVGDEIPIDQLRLFNSNGGGSYEPKGSPFHYYVNNTQIKIFMDSGLTSGAQAGALYHAPNAYGIGPTKWRFRVYAAL